MRDGLACSPISTLSRWSETGEIVQQMKRVRTHLRMEIEMDNEPREDGGRRGRGEEGGNRENWVGLPM